MFQNLRTLNESKALKQNLHAAIGVAKLSLSIPKDENVNTIPIKNSSTIKEETEAVATTLAMIIKESPNDN